MAAVRTRWPRAGRLAEAAARLGLSITAVKKRLQRGQLRGLKVDGRWTAVYLAGLDRAPAGSPDMSTDGRPPLDSSDEPRTVAVQAAPELVAAIQAYQTLVASQATEITYLREQLAALIERVPALAEAAATDQAEARSAPPTTSVPTQPVSRPAEMPPATPGETPPPRRAPWWAFWRWGEGSPA